MVRRTPINCIVNLLDVSDNAPVFESATYTGSVGEVAASGTTVTTVRALDADIGANAVVSYEIVDGNDWVCLRLGP